MPLSELRSVVANGAYTRYLVLDADGDQPLGFVHAKDILRASESETEQDSTVTAREIARAVLTVPETRPIDAILADFQLREEGQMAFVVDEWGVFEGIVTIEDILEEIVGDIQDEFDIGAREPSIEKRADGAYTVDGGVSVREVNERLDTRFESADVETIGGLVFSRLGRVPEVGDQIEENRHVLQVEAVDDARVERLVIRKAETGGGTDDK